MLKIVPHLWFDTQAKEAAEFYVSVFEKSEILDTTVLGNTPSGDATIVRFQLCDMEFQAISGGPYFKFNPSISFMVNCRNKQEVENYWMKLKEGGKILMPLDEYPFSKYYSWIEDKYGVSWQIVMVEDPVYTQKIVPDLLFSGSVCGKAQEAISYYQEVFQNSKLIYQVNYEKNEAISNAKVKYALFSLSEYMMVAADHGAEADFSFNESISFIVYCKDQAEIDYYWEALSFVKEAEQCGWLKDKFGVSWQIVPYQMDDIMQTAYKDQMWDVTEAFSRMKKFDIEMLQALFDKTLEE